jgi:hypothetical protein
MDNDMPDPYPNLPDFHALFRGDLDVAHETLRLMIEGYRRKIALQDAVIEMHRERERVILRAFENE